MVRFACPSCGSACEAPDASFGKSVACHACNALATVPLAAPMARWVSDPEPKAAPPMSWGRWTAIAGGSLFLLVAVLLATQAGRDVLQFAALAFMILVVVVLVGAIYFLPTIVAIIRGHQNALAIIALNLLTGWLFVGWVVSMVWACTEVRKA